MEVWMVKGTNIDGEKSVVGVYSTEAKAEAAEASCRAQQPKGHFWSDGPYVVDAPPNASYY